MDGATTVFISYSWDTEEHKQWVVALARKLQGDGFDIILDQFSMLPGQDMFQFMEQSVMYADKVLIIMTRPYKKKADAREGYAGFEYSIITPNFWRMHHVQLKFIPVLREQPASTSTPIALSSAYACDLSGAYFNEKEYEKLLKALNHDMPPNAFPDKELERRIEGAYAEWLITCHRFLELRGLAKHGVLRIPVDKVFVGLRIDGTPSFERIQSRLLFEKELQEKMDARLFTPGQAREAKWNLVAYGDLIQTPGIGDRPVAYKKENSQAVTLGEAYLKYSRMVILGDPGSGKTTLSRYLALTMARALEAGSQEVTVPLHCLDPAVTDSSSLFTLGRPMIPVPVRISGYAEDRLFFKMQKKTPRGLDEYLGHQRWIDFSLPCLPNAGEISGETLNLFITKKLEENSVLVILDGLDEIPASGDRDEILEEVHRFIARWFDQRPVVQQQNKLIITSRIAGYYASPLSTDIPHLTIEGMSDTAVDRFCDAWMQTVCALDGVDEMEAKEKKAALKAQIHQPSVYRIRAMACSPLLCNILATVFYSNGTFLPERRVDLYEIIVRNLFNIWQQRMELGNYKAKLLDSQIIFSLLEPVAAYIHEHIPTGLLPENKLAEIILTELACIRNENPLHPSAGTVSAASEFIRVLREDVGLLAARAEGVYGFLHLTFQEYLAARYLVRDLSVAGQKLMEKIEDPRWLEPLVMSLGFVSQSRPLAFKGLVTDILSFEGELAGLLPRGALLISSALNEMHPLEEETADKLIDRLLYAYPGRNVGGRLSPLQPLIEKAITELRNNGFEKLAELALSTALAGEKGSAPAAALLIRRLDWYTPGLVQSLMDALPNDTAEWNWPIDNALRKAVTSREPEPPAMPVKPVTNPLLAVLKRQIDLATNPAAQQNLAWKIKQLTVEEDNASKKYEIDNEQYKRIAIQYAETELPRRCEMPSASLPFRQALEDNPVFFQQLTTDPDWLRLVIALYGGMEDAGTPEFMVEYRKISFFLQLPDNQRKSFTPSYQDNWADDDTVMAMAHHLDRHGKRYHALAKKQPVFKPGNIYRDSLLSPLFLRALAKNQPAASVIPELWKIYLKSLVQAERTDAFVALLALGQPVAEQIQQLPAGRLKYESLISAQTRLSQLNAYLADPVSRALNHAIEGLRFIMQKVEPRHWREIVASVLSLATARGGVSVKVSDLLVGCPPDQVTYILAEYIVQAVIGINDDALYNAAIVADWVEGLKGISSADMAECLSLVADTRGIYWSGYMYGWPVEKFTASISAPGDIPMTVFDNIIRINPDISFMGLALLNKLRDMVTANPEMLAELLLVIAKSKAGQGIRESAYGSFFPNTLPLPGSWNSVITRLVFTLKNPYYLSRAIIRLAGFLPAQQEILIEKAEHAADNINDPGQKAQIFLRLLEFRTGSRRAAAVKKLLKLSGKIRNKINRTGILTGIAYKLPISGSERLMAAIFHSISRQHGDIHKAELLRSVIPLTDLHPQYKRLAVRIASGCRAAWCRQMGTGLTGTLLKDVQPLLTGASSDAIHAWPPIVLAAQVKQMQKQLGIAGNDDDLWLLLHNDHSRFEQMYQHTVQNNVQLTTLAAQVITAFLSGPGQAARVGLILPLLQRPEPGVLAFVEEWRAHPDKKIKSYAALLKAEITGLSEDTVPCVIDLLNAENDLLRHRAARLIYHPAITPPEPTRTISGLGSRVFNVLLEESLFQAKQDPKVSLAVGWLQHDLVYDDPGLISQWVQSLDIGDKNAAIASLALSDMSAVTQAVWEQVLISFCSAKKKARFALLIGVSRLVYTKQQVGNKIYTRLSDKQWEAFILTVSDLDLEELKDNIFITEGYPAFIRVVSDAIEKKVGSTESAALWMDMQLMKEFGNSFATILKLPPDEMKRKMHDLASKNFYSGELMYNNDLLTAVEKVKTNTGLLNLLLTWLVHSLEISVYDEKQVPENKRYYLLTLVAAAAQSIPSTFINLANTERLEPLLVKAAQFHNTYPGRAAAVRLLALMRKLSGNIIQVLNTSIRDVVFVREEVFAIAQHFRQTDSHILPVLFRSLYSGSGMAAYFTGQLLVALGKNEKTSAAQRREILLEFSKAIVDRRSQRLVHFGYADAIVPETVRLDEAFYKQMLQVAGLTE